MTATQAAATQLPPAPAKARAAKPKLPRTFRLVRRPVCGTPGEFTVTVHYPRKGPVVDTYSFEEFGSDLPGRAFAIQKQEDGAEVRNVLLTNNGEHSCSCEDGCFRGECGCRHIAAMVCYVRNH